MKKFLLNAPIKYYYTSIYFNILILCIWMHVCVARYCHNQIICACKLYANIIIITCTSPSLSLSSSLCKFIFVLRLLCFTSCSWYVQVRLNFCTCFVHEINWIELNWIAKLIGHTKRCLQKNIENFLWLSFCDMTVSSKSNVPSLWLWPTVQITFIFIGQIRIWFLANAFAPVLRNTQTRFELFWIGLRIRNAFDTFGTFVTFETQILICDLWALGGF